MSRRRLGTTAPAGPVRALRPGWRGVRIAVFGGASLALAAAAHVAGGGGLPGPGVLAVLALVLGLVAAPLTMRRCRLRLLLPVLALEQAAQHLVLAAASAQPEVTPWVAGHACPTPAGAHHAVLGACAAGHPMSAGIGHAVDPSWAMWLGHAVALVATAWLLTRGESFLWRVADGIAAAAAPVRTRFAYVGSPFVVASVVSCPSRHGSPPPARGPPVPV